VPLNIEEGDNEQRSTLNGTEPTQKLVLNGRLGDNRMNILSTREPTTTGLHFLHVEYVGDFFLSPFL
jgi:hypothetical protein